MATKLINGARVELTTEELAELEVFQTANQMEKDRLVNRTPEEQVEEDLLAPLFDTANEANLKILKAAVLVLLDGLNIERAARGAATITPAQLRAQIKNKLVELI